MPLTVFLFKVANLEITKTKSDLFADNEQTINDEHMFLSCVKVTFRGINLWSNNVPIQDGTANFIARENKTKEFDFNLATMLLPDDKLRIEFYTVPIKTNRKKWIAIFELILESLIDPKSIDLQEENLSDPNNYLIKSTVQLKLCYTSPNTDQERSALGAANDEAKIVDWKHQHVLSKHDNVSTKFRRKFISRQDEVDTDSYSDPDFDENQDTDETLPSMTEGSIYLSYNSSKNEILIYFF